MIAPKLGTTQIPIHKRMDESYAEPLCGNEKARAPATHENVDKMQTNNEE